MTLLFSKLGSLFFHLSFLLIRLSKASPVESKPAKTSHSEPANSAIVVTTFEPRFFSDCLPLILDIREGGVLDPIYVVINTDFSDTFDPDVRSDFLARISEIDNCFPVCLGRAHGVASLWNFGIRASGAKTVVLLNDDLIVNKDFVKATLDTLIQSAEQSGLSILNSSFGTFAITLKCIEQIGWFDERFLGIGEEDGDYFWRYQDHFKSPPPTIQAGGLLNAVKDSGYNSVVSQPTNKYSLFNWHFLRLKYAFEEGGQHGMFACSARKVLSETTNYASDFWYWNLRHLLKETSNEKIIEEVRSYLNESHRGL